MVEVRELQVANRQIQADGKIQVLGLGAHEHGLAGTHDAGHVHVVADELLDAVDLQQTGVRLQALQVEEQVGRHHERVAAQVAGLG